MMHKWFPWRYVVTRLARSHGFLDPLTLYARLQRFAQPSEVSEPVELLRAGAVFHARGLLNSRVLQHNLDWVWPYWVERQFNPADVSFVPRAFSLTHINLTHRNWTAVGLPGRKALPIIDPRGLLTPFWDSWSIDVWCIDENGQTLLPCRVTGAEQWQVMDEEHTVMTRTDDNGMQLETGCRMVAGEQGDRIRLTARCSMDNAGWLVVALRPANPEGVSFIEHVQFDEPTRTWTVNDENTVVFDQAPDEHHASRYHEGDVFVHLRDRIQADSCRCPVGLVTAAASFKVTSSTSRSISLDIPVKPAPPERRPVSPRTPWPTQTWGTALEQQAQLELPDARLKSLYDAAVRTLVLCTPDDCHAGPFTYKRYWYRDAVFIGHGLLSAGLIDRARHLINRFPERQSHSGYYHSQEGEWDANGEVLWLADRFSQMTGELPDSRLWSSLSKAAEWIQRKRLPDYGGQPHEGLLPAGFSAEHLGPNDHYYWDNYWALAGLHSAARLAAVLGKEELAEHHEEQAMLFSAAIERSLQKLSHTDGRLAIPAAPTRRLDAGAIGSVVVAYPLQLCAPDDERLRGTLEYLLKNCFHEDGFFQDMIHSGVNAYLTLHVAQALLRSGDERFAALLNEVARIASPAGHWPEAVHPNTGGGCMGDGHHAWAAAEWISMLRNCFVREESESLILASGILPQWLDAGTELSLGMVPTLFGDSRIVILPANAGDSGREVKWEARWHGKAPTLEVRLYGHEPVVIHEAGDSGSVICTRIAG